MPKSANKPRTRRKSRRPGESRRPRSQTQVVGEEVALSSAIAARDLDSVNTLLESGPGLEALSGQLEQAADAFDEEIVLTLIRARVPVDYAGAKSVYAEAARQGSIRVIRALLDQGVRVPDDETNVLEIAIEAGHVDIVRSLLESGHDTRLLDSDENTALMVAVSSGYAEIVDLTMDVCDVNATNAHSQTALMLACQQADERAVRNLLSQGARIDLEDYGRESTALAYAVRAGSPTIVRLLLDRGADPNERATANLQNRYGDPVLVSGARVGHDDVCQVLLESGANVDERSSAGCTAIYAAAQHGHARLVRLLLGWKASPHDPDRQGVTPLMAAARHTSTGHVAAIHALLEADVALDARDQFGNTALIHAVSSGSCDGVIKALLEGGAEINAQNAAGDTAWTAGAANHAQHPTLSLLARSGARTNHRNGSGESAVTVAVKKRAKPRTVHFASAEQQEVSTVKALLALGSPVNEQDADGNTPLIVASCAGEVELVVELLRYKARKDLPNLNGQTALDAAKANQHDKVVSVLEG